MLFSECRLLVTEMRFFRAAVSPVAVLVASLAIGAFNRPAEALPEAALSSASLVPDSGGRSSEFLGVRPRILAAADGGAPEEGKKETPETPKAPTEQPAEVRARWLLAERKTDADAGVLLKYVQAQVDLCMRESLVAVREDMLNASSNKGAAGVPVGIRVAPIPKDTKLTPTERRGLQEELDRVAPALAELAPSGAIRLLWGDLWLKKALFGVDPLGDGTEVSEEKRRSLIEQQIRAAGNVSDAEADSVARAKEILDWLAKRTAAFARVHELRAEIHKVEEAVRDAEQNYEGAKERAEQAARDLEIAANLGIELAEKEQQLKKASLETADAKTLFEKYETLLELRRLAATRKGTRRVFEVLEKAKEAQLEAQTKAMNILSKNQNVLTSLKNTLKEITGPGEVISWMIGGLPPLTADEKKRLLFNFYKEVAVVDAVRKGAGKDWWAVVSERRGVALQEMKRLSERAAALKMAVDALPN